MYLLIDVLLVLLDVLRVALVCLLSEVLVVTVNGLDKGSLLC